MTNRVNELFGLYTNGDEFPDLSEALLMQKCPWAQNNSTCFKTRKSDSSIAIGTCSLCFDKLDQPLIICPSRLKDRNQIFIDCLQFITGSITGSELYLIPEVGTSAGSIDFMLVAARGKTPVDFVAIELQTLDTTGSIWNYRQKLLKDNGYDVEDGRSKGCVGVNWKMTAKTILAQMVQKSELFADMSKNLVLVCQSPLYAYMERNFNFSNVRSIPDNRDVLHFHMYDYRPIDGKMRLSLASTRSASLQVVQGIMGRNTDVNQELSEILSTLSSRLRPEYRFEPLENVN